MRYILHGCSYFSIYRCLLHYHKTMAPRVKIGIIGGSGMDNPDILKNRKQKRINDTPYGKPSDDIILGDISGVSCVLLARHGIKHDIMPGNINYRANIWALKEEGCTHIIATTATGSLREEYKPGDIVILNSFIDRTQGRKNTFYDGLPGHPTGICHLQMEPSFNEETRQILINTAKELNLDFHETGTVVAIEGPRFSSKAESNMYRQWGGHVVNMTSMPEVSLAKEAGICYAAIALITDYDCWKDEIVSANAVIKMFEKNTEKVIQLLLNVVPKIANEDWTKTIKDLEDTINNSVMM